MADTHVDLTGSGSNTSPYDTWAKAATTIQAGITTAGAGGNCFVKCGATNTDNPDTAAGTRTITSPGLITNPVTIYGVKNGTTNEGSSIVGSDLVAKGDADVPILEATGATGDINLQEANSFYGINIIAGRRIKFNCISSTSYDHSFENSKLTIGVSAAGYIEVTGRNTDAESYLELRNSDIEFTNATDTLFAAASGSRFKWFGGALIGTAPTNLFDGATTQLIVELVGVDLSGVSGTLVEVTDLVGPKIKFLNCEFHASVTLASSLLNGRATEIEAFGCSSASAISTSVLNYEAYFGNGTIVHETTRIRTGGATDGAAGGFSWAMTPNANAVRFPGITLKSSPMAIWLDGTETTVTVYIANNSAATDVQDDEVWLEVIASDSTLDTAQYVLDDDKMALLGTPANQTDDTGSTWGSGANNHQKLEVTIAPGYEGWATCFVHCCERAASPKIVYVDPLPVLS